MKMLKLFEESSSYTQMREISDEEYREFLSHNDYVIIENSKIRLFKKYKIKKFEPDDFKLETTTVWSFPKRGDWATHRSDYRGNWSPYIPRNLILRYTFENELVLDPMVGSGTTLVECKLLNRRAIGVDINYYAIMITKNRLDFEYKYSPEIKTYLGDARNLNLIEDESVDLILAHPPYGNIIKFSNKIEGDLSNTSTPDDFVKEMKKVASELYRVSKPSKHCAILIGDTRKNKHYVPLSARILEVFLEVGFILREDIIKIQWNMKSTREKWRSKEYDFMLISHEHLFVFRKPSKNEKLSKYKYSSDWKHV